MRSIGHRHALARASAETAGQIARSCLSCEQSDRDILTSRRAISRSLDLLLTTSSFVIAQRD